MGAMLSLISIGNRFFKPVVDRRKCIRVNGGDCHICSNVCTEGLDPHCSASLNECSKCGLCKDSCPSDAITFAFMPK
ncbi:MAG TPA: 4Fe-4S ferredoxin, partial [Coriobacteriia bacterium]|nr:4Fe-4S ferredoxin [Coriobacteriia bacterium]